MSLMCCLLAFLGIHYVIFDFNNKTHFQKILVL